MVRIWKHHIDVKNNCFLFWDHKYHSNTLYGQNVEFLGAFAKLRKATTSFVMSVRSSVSMKLLGCHMTDFSEIWCLRIFRKYVEKLQFLSNLTKITDALREDPCTFMIVLRRILLRMRNVSDTSCIENQNSHMSNIFSPKIMPFMRHYGKIW
jgi:hypothetical protein